MNPYKIWEPHEAFKFTRRYGVSKLDPAYGGEVYERVLNFTREEADVVVRALNAWAAVREIQHRFSPYSENPVLCGVIVGPDSRRCAEPAKRHAS